MRLLVSGATGFVGRHLLPRLLSAGHVVIRLRRDAATGLPETEWALPGGLRSAESAPGFPADVDAVIHLAAMNPAKNDKDSGCHRVLQEANVEGSAALARRSAREGVRRFVFLSTANVHAVGSADRPITENDPIEPQSPYARSKADAEVALRSALANTRTRYCIIRPAPVFGIGGRGTVSRLARLAATPAPIPLKGLGGRRSLIAVEDLVEAILLATTAEGASDETLLLAGGAARPEEIVHELRAGLGRSPRLLPAPAGIAGALAHRLGKGQAFETLTRDFVLDPGRAQKALGWTAAESLQERLRHAGRMMRAPSSTAGTPAMPANSVRSRQPAVGRGSGATYPDPPSDAAPSAPTRSYERGDEGPARPRRDGRSDRHVEGPGR